MMQDTSYETALAIIGMSGRFPGAANVREKGHGGGSTDMGDLSHILPTVHPYAGGAT